MTELSKNLQKECVAFRKVSIMNNNIKMNFTNTTLAFTTTSHNHGITANTIPTSYLRKNTENAYAKCKADMERRKQRDYIIKHGSFYQAMDAFFTKI